MPAKVEGIAWMVLTGLLFASVTGTVRYLGSDMPAPQAAFLRYAFGLVLTVPVLMRLGRQWLRPERPGLLVARGACHAVGVMLWFYAMARIPVAEVTAIGFTAPLFITIGAALFLGEQLRARRVAAVVVGFLGTLLILQPGIRIIEAGALAQLAAAPVLAGSYLIAKKLTESESSGAIVAYLSILVTVALAPLAALHWRAPTLEELALLFATAIFATAGHYTMTRAMRATELTVLQPFQFLQLVWASLLGLYAFGEVPRAGTILGGLVIVACASYLAHRETRQSAGTT